MRVTVTEYDPRWPEQFTRLREVLLAALRDVDVLAVEHVGSTAVPGLRAKPVIDVDVVVARPSLAGALGALGALGYTYVGEQGVTDRHALRAPDDGVPRHVYVCLEGSVALRNHLLVRDALRQDAALRDEYARVKEDLARRDLPDMDAYVAGKTPVLQRILASRGLNATELAAIAAQNPTS
jgi:GrpB-like predicted nucleotidyltransferase (UPF0157 family)